MPTTNVRNLAGIDITITQEDLDGLTASVRGQVLLPGSTAYDTARTIWNAMIDRRPGLIVGAASAADVDHDAQVFGLATPLGINSTTGVAGLTLGGGFGWLTRKYGMSVDNLIAAEVVTADAKRVRAS